MDILERNEYSDTPSTSNAKDGSSLLKRGWFYWCYLSVLALADMGIALVIISRYGAGVSSDSVTYLSTSENLRNGIGLMDHTGAPLLNWPPAYSAALAVASLLTGQAVLAAGGMLNIVLLGVNTVLAGVLLRQAFPKTIIYPLLGSLFLALSESLLRIHVTILSDPLFLTVTFAFLIAANRYAALRSRLALWTMFFISALAPLIRWPGFFLITCSALFTLFIERNRMRSSLLKTALLSILACIPAVCWVIFHNWLPYHTFWGQQGNEPIYPWLNFNYSLTKILHWFLPYHPTLQPVLFHPLLTIAVFLLVLAAINRRDHWLEFLGALVQPNRIAAVGFGVIFFLALTFITDTLAHRDPTSDRYYVPLMLPLLIFLFVAWESLIALALKLQPPRSNTVLVVLFAFWSLYPIVGNIKYVRLAREEGEPSHYNFYNNATYHEMPVVQEMIRLGAEEPQAAFYSNYVDAVWFLTHHSASPLPYGTTQELFSDYPGWPGDKRGYIVWFLPNEYKYLTKPEFLADIADVRLIYADKSGNIYSVRSR